MAARPGIVETKEGLLVEAALGKDRIGSAVWEVLEARQYGASRGVGDGAGRGNPPHSYLSRKSLNLWVLHVIV
jgi:hypothetical protein